MASASVSGGATTRPPQNTIIAVVAILSLALWPVELGSAFGLPAHPLLVHMPVIFVPVLGLATLAVAFNQRWFERVGPLVAAFSVVALAATLLAAGAGEALQEERASFGGPNPTLQDHEDAASTLRITLVLLTATLVGLLFARPLPRAATIALRVLAALFALIAIVFVIRTGHLGAKLVWSDPPGWTADPELRGTGGPGGGSAPGPGGMRPGAGPPGGNG